MRVVVALGLLLSLGGCAASHKARSTAFPADSKLGSEPEDAAAGGDDLLQRRVAELETRIALLEAEARRTRDRGPLAPTEPVRIGRHREEPSEPRDVEASEPAVETVEAERPARSRERVPMLRLYGEPQAELTPLPTSNETLSVVPLPEDRAGSIGAPGEAAALAYRNALRALREQRYDDAIGGFAGFVATYPEHALTGSALYWSGEAHYARREYQKAREVFDKLLSKFANSDKVPDALVKLGLCLRQLGEETQAQACFRRVREKYPNTQAAVIAVREGST